MSTLLRTIAKITNSDEVRLAAMLECRAAIELGAAPIDEALPLGGVYSPRALHEQTIRYKQLMEQNFPIPSGIDAIYIIQPITDRGFHSYQLVISYGELDEKAYAWANSIPVPRTWNEWGSF